VSTNDDEENQICVLTPTYVSTPDTAALQSRYTPPPIREPILPSENVAFRRSGRLRTPSGELSNVLADPDIATKGLVARNPAANVSAIEHATGLARRIVTIEGEQVVVSDSQWISASRNRLTAEQFSGTEYVIDITRFPEGIRVVDSPELLEQGRQRGVPEAWFRNQTEARIGGPPEAEVLFSPRVPPEAITPVSELPTRIVQPPAPQLPTEGFAGWIGRHGSKVSKGLTGVGIGFSAIRVYNAAEQSLDIGSFRPLAAESIRQAGAWGGSILGGRVGGAIGGAAGGGSGLAGGPAAPGTVPAGAIVGGFIGGIAGSLGGGYLGFEVGDYFADMIYPD
jgi:hypothetical protein